MDSTSVLKLLEVNLWKYFKKNLKRKLTLICTTFIPCHFSTIGTYAKIITCPTQSKLISLKDRLHKGFNKKDFRDNLY